MAVLVSLVVLAVAGSLTTHAAAQIPMARPPERPFSEQDIFQFALNLEYLEAEFYLHSAYGKGLEGFAPQLTGGGPPSVGGRKAVLSEPVQKIAEEFGLIEIGHVRILREFLGSAAVPRPAIDISVQTWTTFARLALGPLSAPFDPYANDANWLLAAFILPYVGLTAYVGANPLLNSQNAKALLGGVLGVEAGQDAVLRTILWEKKAELVPTAGRPIIAITGAITAARNRLDRAGTVDDENVEVTPNLGAEGKTSTNILAANSDSLSYARNPKEVLRIVYGTSGASNPGGFLPMGAAGTIGAFYITSRADPAPPHL